jgi:hypothetical protein
MLTQKLLGAVGLAGALLLGVSADASANPWRRHSAPVYRAPVVGVPPVYRAPVYAPAPPVVVYQAPVYRPAYRPVVWRHHPHWARPYGHRW